mgnify:CR=1 FL=1
MSLETAANPRKEPKFMTFNSIFNNGTREVISLPAPFLA